MQRENIQINKIRNKKWDITPNSGETQIIIRPYFKIMFSTKLENLKEVDRFLDRYHIPIINQEQINNFNTDITSKEI